MQRSISSTSNSKNKGLDSSLKSPMSSLDLNNQYNNFDESTNNYDAMDFEEEEKESDTSSIISSIVRSDKSITSESEFGELGLEEEEEIF